MQLSASHGVINSFGRETDITYLIFQRYLLPNYKALLLYDLYLFLYKPIHCERAVRCDLGNREQLSASRLDRKFRMKLLISFCFII